jgi:hypothetical protein
MMEIVLLACDSSYGSRKVCTTSEGEVKRSKARDVISGEQQNFRNDPLVILKKNSLGTIERSRKVRNPLPSFPRLGVCVLFDTFNSRS